MFFNKTMSIEKRAEKCIEFGVWKIALERRKGRDQ